MKSISFFLATVISLWAQLGLAESPYYDPYYDPFRSFYFEPVDPYARGRRTYTPNQNPAPAPRTVEPMAPPANEPAPAQEAREVEWVEYEDAWDINDKTKKPWLIFITQDGRCRACEDNEYAFTREKVQKALEGFVLTRLVRPDARVRAVTKFLFDSRYLEGHELNGPIMLIVDGKYTRVVLGGVDEHNMVRFIKDQRLTPRPDCDHRAAHKGDPGLLKEQEARAKEAPAPQTEQPRVEETPREQGNRETRDSFYYDPFQDFDNRKSGNGRRKI